MGTEVINVTFDVLQEELDKAKSTLKGLNDNIRRISGREPPEQLRLVYRITKCSLFKLTRNQPFSIVWHELFDENVKTCAEVTASVH